MAEELTPEELEILDEMHAQLKQMTQLLERQNAQLRAQLEHQRVTDMARFDRVDRLLAQLTQSMTSVKENPGKPVNSSSTGENNLSSEVASSVANHAVFPLPVNRDGQIQSQSSNYSQTQLWWRAVRKNASQSSSSDQLKCGSIMISATENERLADGVHYSK